MPIRPVNRKYYDARWRKFRLGMLDAAGNVCQRCGQPIRPHDPTDKQFRRASESRGWRRRYRLRACLKQRPSNA